MQHVSARAPRARPPPRERELSSHARALFSQRDAAMPAADEGGVAARTDAAEALRIAEINMFHGGTRAADLSTAPAPLYAPSLSSVSALSMTQHRALGGAFGALGALGAQQQQEQQQPRAASGGPPAHAPIGAPLFGRATIALALDPSAACEAGASSIAAMPPAGAQRDPVVQRFFTELPVPESRSERPNKLYPRSGLRGTPQGFPYKLFEILSRPDQFGDIISWSPSGRSFVILDRAALMRDVLPRYMNQAEWTSFQRQLNNFGMRTVARQSHDSDEPPEAYVHPLFRRDRPDLLNNVRRKRQDRPSEAGKRPRKHKSAAATPQASVGQVQIPVSPILPEPDSRADPPSPAPTSFDIESPQFVYPDGEASALSSGRNAELYFEPLSPTTSRNWANSEGAQT